MKINNSIFLFLLLFIVPFNNAQAKKPLVVDLSSNIIKINANFSGIDILLFGSKNNEGEIIIVIRGPKETYNLRKKAKIANLWINKEEIRLIDVSSFYSVSATKPLQQFDSKLLSELAISLDDIYFKNIRKKDSSNLTEFKQAFLEAKQEQKLYSKRVNEIVLTGGTLFRVAVHFPGTIGSGTYNVETYLINKNNLISKHYTSIEVVRTGLDALIYDIAHKRPFSYAIIAISIAIVAGALVGILFNRKK